MVVVEEYDRLVASAAERRESFPEHLMHFPVLPEDRAPQVAAWLCAQERLNPPLVAEDARIWCRLSQDIGHGGANLMIAATALARGATVVTGNTEDFRPTGERLENPFAV